MQKMKNAWNWISFIHPVARITLLAGLSVFPVYALDTTWQGLSANWNSGSNWDNGLPNATDNDDTAIFNSPAGLFQPTGLTRESVNNLTFNAGGWTIGSNPGSTALRFLGPATIAFNSATNLGTVEISIIEVDGNNLTADIAEGNTLIIGQTQNSNRSFHEKNGSGTLIFSSGGTFDQTPSTINGGKFLMNGTASNKSITVATGATLGGIGTFDFVNARSININDGGTLALGEDTASAGTLTVVGTDANDSDVNLASNTSFAVDIFGDGSSDMLRVDHTSGSNQTALNISSGVSLDLFGTAAYNSAYTLAQITGRGSYDGSIFDSVTLNGNTLTDGVDYTMTYTAHNPGDLSDGSISITVIPEPSSLLFVLTGFSGVLCFVRYNRKKS